MHAVKTQAFDHKHMVFNDNRHVPLMRDQAAGIARAQDHLLILRRQRQPHTGHLDPVQHPRQPVGKHLQLKGGRGNQRDLRTIFNGGGGGHVRLLRHPPRVSAFFQLGYRGLAFPRGGRWLIWRELPDQRCRP